MNQQERNKLLNKIEAIPEAVQQVIKMLDKNIAESLNYSADQEIVLLVSMQKKLIKEQGFTDKETGIAIQYLVGRLVAQDFKSSSYDWRY